MTADPRYHRGPMAQAQSPESSLIHARGLTKRFGDFTAVDAIDFDVAPGEAFGFLGPTGAGKTSPMRMIGCVSPKTEGTLTVLGMEPATHGPLIRARIGVVPQEDTLDQEMTVRDNLVIYGRYFNLPRAEARRRADQLLDFVQLADRAGRFATGADRPVLLPRGARTPLCVGHRRVAGRAARAASRRARRTRGAPARQGARLRGGWRGRCRRGPRCRTQTGEQPRATEHAGGRLSTAHRSQPDRVASLTE